ncbi:MAG: hypothetical protein NT157_06425 [Candidatus Micrarchaeota archaeon]|nr:hypothetical protein [Candidatus Micrarchaeota archaeon]
MGKLAIPLAVLLLSISILFFGCIRGFGLADCEREAPYTENETYFETVPRELSVCENFTAEENESILECQNVTFVQNRTETICGNRTMRFGEYYFTTSRACERTYTPGVNWEPQCLERSITCAVTIKNFESEAGSWTVAMRLELSNGSTVSFEPETREITALYSQNFSWKETLDDVKDDGLCYYEVKSRPSMTECRNVARQENATVQNCTSVFEPQNVTREECSEKVGYVQEERTREVTKYAKVVEKC